MSAIVTSSGSPGAVMRPDYRIKLAAASLRTKTVVTWRALRAQPRPCRLASLVMASTNSSQTHEEISIFCAEAQPAAAGEKVRARALVFGEPSSPCLVEPEPAQRAHHGDVRPRRAALRWD